MIVLVKCFADHGSPQTLKAIRHGRRLVVAEVQGEHRYPVHLYCVWGRFWALGATWFS